MRLGTRGPGARELFRKCGEAGLLCVDVPEAWGGLGADPRFSFAIVDVMSRRGYAGFVGGLQVTTISSRPTCCIAGTGEHKQHWLPKMVSGEVVAAIGMTEPGAAAISRTSVPWRAARATSTW